MELEHFAERMQRILLMAPLYRLGRRHFKTVDGKDVSGMELGLMTLLFFFEQMLDGKKKAGIRNLSLFLKQAVRGRLFSDDAAYEQLARDIVAVFRPPTGRRNEESFYDWEQDTEGTAQYSYLKADKADVSANEQYYVLDEQGLELIFATKEYFNEYQLSINQLILRKQLEKGQFVLALRQIEEMRLDVETLRGRMTRIRQEIHRNIVSEETLDRYRHIVEDLNSRLKSEEETFTELRDFVKETRQRIHDNAGDDPVRKAYDNILDVERRLEFVHNLHRSLLQAGIELGTSALAAAEEALYFSGIDSFNFEQEITHRVFSSPLPVEASRRLIEPFMSLEQCRIWSPLAVFFPQRLERMEQDNENEAFPQMREDEENARESRNLHNLQEHYAAIVRFLLDFMGEKRETTLADFCGYLQETEPSWLDNRQFYLFWMLLHCQGTLVMSEDSIGPSSVYAAVIRQCPELRSIRVVECSQILDFSGYAISDMNIEVTVNDGTESE